MKLLKLMILLPIYTGLSERVITNKNGYVTANAINGIQAESWTICFKFRPEKINLTAVFDIPASNSAKSIFSFLLLHHDYTFIWVQQISYMLPHSFKMFQWNSVCTQYSPLAKKLTVTCDNIEYNLNITIGDAHENITSTSISNMKIGANKIGERSTNGKYGKIQVWDSYVNDDVIEMYMKCKDLSPGNIFDSNVDDLVLVNSVVEEISAEKLCEPNVPGLAFLSVTTNFDNTETICKRLGGDIKAFEKDTDKITMIGEYNKTLSCHVSNAIWSGYSDRDKEGTFKSEGVEPVVLDYSDFDFGEPNGGKIENCAAFRVSNYKHLDVGCTEKRCGACDLPFLPIFHLRGTIPGNVKIDQEYFWTREISNERYIFEGLQHSKLIALNSNTWEILDSNTGESIFQLSEHLYPMGIYEWLDLKSNESLVLSFDVCNATQFNCNNGMCIGMALRCNEVKDCDDNSDELDCNLVELPDDYNMDNAPQNLNKSGLLDIEISKFKMSIEDIVDTKNIIEIQFGMTSVWFDSRLTFLNLDMNRLNQVSEAEKLSIWRPKYTIWKADSEGLQEDKSFEVLTVKPLEEGQPSDYRDTVASIKFSGEKTQLILKQWFKAKVVCQNTQVGYFPFDKNLCSFKIMPFASPQSWYDNNEQKILFNKTFTLEYVKDNIKMYSLEEIASEITLGGNIKIKIYLRRSFLGIFMQNALPNMLLSIVVFSTNIYYRDSFEAGIAVNVTCLLAMSGFFIAILQNLPQTPGIKIIDLLQIKYIVLAIGTTLLQTLDVNQTIWNHDKGRMETVYKRILGTTIFWLLPLVGFTLDVIFMMAGILYEFKQI